MSPRKTLDQDRKRFTLWLPTATADELERLQTEMGKGAIAEIVRVGRREAGDNTRMVSWQLQNRPAGL